MTAFLLLILALVTISMVILILLQRTDASAGGVFGGSGSNQPVVRNPLAKPTAILAGVFLVLCLLLAYSNNGSHHGSSLMNEAATPAAVNDISGTQAVPGPGNAILPVVPTVDVTPSVTPDSLVTPTQPISPTA